MDLDQKLNQHFAGRVVRKDLTKKIKEGGIYATRLSPLVEGEMDWVLRDVDKLNPKDSQTALAKRLGEIENRQSYILTELIALLGLIADNEQKHAKTNQLGKEIDNAPLIADIGVTAAADAGVAAGAPTRLPSSRPNARLPVSSASGATGRRRLNSLSK